MSPRVRLLAAVAAASLLLAGCSADPDPVGSSPTASPAPTASTAPSASSSASASPSTTLSAEKQQAVDETTAVVLAYEQMFYDLLADPSRPLNDLNDVAAQPQLARDLRSVQQLRVKLNAGTATIDSSGPVRLASVKLLKVDLAGDPPTVTLLVCVDQSAASGTEDGKPWTGKRQESRYRVVKTTYLPAPGWAVSKLLPPPGHDQPQPC